MEDDEIKVEQRFSDQGLLITFKSIEVITHGKPLEKYYRRIGSDTIILKDTYCICINKIEDITTEELRIILWNLWKITHNIKFAPVDFNNIKEIAEPDIKAIFAFLKPD